MFLSIAAEGEGAKTLSFTIQKNPTKLFERGSLKLFFPVYGEKKANFVTMVEFEEFKLWNQDTPKADAYVTSREYALSSLFCREIKKALNTAIKGDYKDPMDAANADKPLNLTIDALPLCTSLSDEQLRGLFNPLRYAGFTPACVVDHSHKYGWMPQKHRVLELAVQTHKTVREVLRHLLVLIPVIDDYTHYSELDSLVNELKDLGEGWLDSHPMKDLITKRFLRHRKGLLKTFSDSQPKDETVSEEAVEKKINLGQFRTEWFVNQAKKLEAKSVVDAGCGSGRLAEAFNAAGILQVTAIDCHPRAVQMAQRWLRNKAEVFWSSLLYNDDRLKGKDLIVLQEVIEHMHPFALERAMKNIFGTYKPKHVLMSTPNRSYNKFFEMKETMRHSDHKFEWNEDEAKAFALDISSTYGYSCRIESIGLAWVPPVKKSEGSVAVAEPVAIDIAPTFGFIFERTT